MEHITPESRGGPATLENIALSCVSCNSAKGNRTAEEFGHPLVRIAARKVADLVRGALAGEAAKQRELEELIGTHVGRPWPGMTSTVYASPFCRRQSGLGALADPYKLILQLSFPGEEWRWRATGGSSLRLMVEG